MRWAPLLVLLPLACMPDREDDVILEGRVRWEVESDVPVDRAFVRVRDANKTQRCFVTACDGTFSVRKEDFPNLTMPLFDVTVERVDRPEGKLGTTSTLAVRKMRGPIDGQRSCNDCHRNGVPLGFTPASVSESCVEGNGGVEIRCPEDRDVPTGEVQVVRDFTAYAGAVHDALAKKCGGCHSGVAPGFVITADRAATYRMVTGYDAAFFVGKPRGELAHGGGRVIVPGDAADQCLADWLGVPRAPSTVARTHVEACVEAAR